MQTLPRPLRDHQSVNARVRPATRHALLWVGAVGLTVALQWSWLVLYLDIRYTLGAFRSGGQLGRGVPDIFIHRPLANRLLMSWLDHLTFGATVLRERLTLTLAVLLAGLAGAGLHRALRHWTSAGTATAVGLATFTALAWAPAVAVLQPEWLAAVLSVGALAASLARGPRRTVHWASPPMVVAGLLLAVAALQKYTTATDAAVVVGLLFVLHRRRAWLVAGWTAALTATLFGLTLLNQHERQWFRDMPRLNPGGGLNWASLGTSLWNLAWLNPVLLFWPAAVVLGSGLFRRRSWIVGSVLAVVVLLAGVLVQNSFFPYHYAALPVLAAGQLALACGEWLRRTGRLPGVALVGLAWVPIAGWLGRRPDSWRVEHAHWGPAAVGVVIVVAAGAAGVAVRTVRQPRAWSSRSAGPSVLLLTASFLGLLTSFAAWPHTPQASYLARSSRAVQVAERVRAVQVGQELRAAAGGAPVVYLARQDVPYFVGLPTSCPYPTATFLYRSARLTDPPGVPSFTENLACLRDPTAEFLVLQPAMLDDSRAVPRVAETVEAEFDCEHPTTRAGSFVLCPRR